MLNKIIEEPNLFALHRSACEENGICIRVCDKLLDNGELRHDLITILKVDAYYCSKHMHNPPPAIDCLVVVKSEDAAFGLTLVELRNVSSARGIHPREIRPKFDTTINDFLSVKFANIFLCNDFEISHFQLWLVTNPYNWPPLSEEQYLKKVKGTVLDMYLSDKPYRFRNKVALIERKEPSSEICLTPISNQPPAEEVTAQNPQ